jgi:hypothetical protein
MSVAVGGRILTVPMIGSVVTPRVTPTGRGRTLRRPGAAPSQRAERLERAVRGRRALGLDTVVSHWQLALDAAQRALTAAAGTLPAAELEQRRRELVQERQQTASALERLAQASLIAAETTDAIGEAARPSCRAAGAARAPQARRPCATTRPLGSAPRSGRTGAAAGSRRRRTHTWPWCRPARRR